MASSSTSLKLRRAELSDVKEMAPIFARSFHPISEYMRTAMPDTPVIQAWWESIHLYSISSPDISVYVVTAPTQDSYRKEEIIALARWRFSRSTWNEEAGNEILLDQPSSDPNPFDCKGHGDLPAGTWSLPLTPDHDKDLCESFIDFITSTRKQYVSNRSHVLIELVLCVHEAKGLGVGRMLMEQCLKEADEGGLPVFVETNGAIVPFYKKFGFQEKARIPMPGGMEYQEIVLLRPAVGEGKV
ncbi:hypothetical protein L218DRAFT_964641 [Marasmius fiardii PR-910]|nr:hypothetical protein L218DRAFT_964641 [Marasmius fiardii PR-910]